MQEEKLSSIRSGLETAYINGNVASELSYKPSFVSNNYSEGKKVLSVIEDELLKCDRFQISVAFITLGGVTPLLQTLKELEQKGIPGEILTSNYLDFSEPLALKKLHSLSNIQIKMYDTKAAHNGFHTKGYIFKEEEVYRIIIGSSNMTSAALTTNREWNTKLVSTTQGEMAEDILKEFDELWNSKYAYDYDSFYEEYKQTYDIIKAQKKIAKDGNVTSFERYRLKPNSMQVRFISNLRNILQQNEHYEGQVEFEESKMPVFEADNDDFTLTLYNLNYGSSYATQTNENVTQGDTQDDTQGDTQDDTQEKIIKMIEKNPRISTADMAKELGVGIATVKRKIKKMSNVSYIGSGYSGHWEIK